MTLAIASYKSGGNRTKVSSGTAGNYGSTLLYTTQSFTKDSVHASMREIFEAMPPFTLDHTPLYVIFNPHQSIASGCFSGDGNAGMDTKVLVSCLLLLLYASIHAKAVPVLENTVPSA